MKKEEPRVRYTITKHETWTCPRCNGNYSTSYQDDYGSLQWERCKHCFLGMILKRTDMDAKPNKNGTYSPIKRKQKT